MDAALDSSEFPPPAEGLTASRRVPAAAGRSEGFSSSCGDERSGVQERDEVAPCTLQAARQGNADAMHQFIRLYERRVFAFLSRAVGHGPHVEDLAQEVFLRVFRALPRFELRQAKVSTWVLQIAVRLIQDRNKRVQPIWVHETEQLLGSTMSPEEQCQRRRALTRVEQAVELLPAEQRVALVLFEFHGLSHQEIAQATGARLSTVKTRLHRARTALKAQLREELEP